MIFNLSLNDLKDAFTDWWTKEKKTNPAEATVGSAVVGSVSSTAGVACVGNGLHRLIAGENTYAGVGPILTIIGGLVFTVLGIRSFSECGKLYKEIKAKEAAKENKNKE